LPHSSSALSLRAWGSKWLVVLLGCAIFAAGSFYFLTRPIEGVTVRGVPSCANCTVLAIADALPDLRHELLNTLEKENIGVNDMRCSGHMLGRQWGHLSYGEVTPFYCQVGSRTLIVDGGNTYLDQEGKKLTSYDQAMYDNAVAVDHPLPHWKWK